MNNKFLGMLGLCTKAGATKSGAFAVTKAIKNGEAYLVIVSTDASEATKKDYENMARQAGCEFLIYGTKEELGGASGKEVRTALCITDENLSKTLLSKLTLDGEEK